MKKFIQSIIPWYVFFFLKWTDKKGRKEYLSTKYKFFIIDSPKQVKKQKMQGYKIVIAIDFQISLARTKSDYVIWSRTCKNAARIIISIGVSCRADLFELL